MRLVTVAFFALAAYVGVRSLLDLVAGSRPGESAVRIGLAIVSLIVMRLLAWRKRAVARELDRLERREHSTRPVETGDETTYRRRSAPSTQLRPREPTIAASRALTPRSASLRCTRAPT